jgi:ABC-2 type transport system permease protein
MTTPTTVPQILMGKIGGTFLTGILQFVVLVVVSRFAFQVHWSDTPLPLILMTVATVLAATSLGAFLASFARNANQAGSIGTTVNLVFAILGGNFIMTTAFPSWLTFFSKLTINRWALNGFVKLALEGGVLVDVLANVGILSGMAVVFFAGAAVLFNRRCVR